MTSFLHNYLRTISRSIRSQKALFAINLTGLTLAIACLLFALIYIHDERQVDKYHPESEHIYRLYKRHIDVGEDVDHLTYETSGMMGPTIIAEYPVVTNYARVLPWFEDVYLTSDEKTITIPNLYFADSTYLDLFHVKMYRGLAKKALEAPGSIVLSQDIATALFGATDPLGQRIVGINDVELVVTGIFEPLPRQASLQPQALISWSTTLANGPMPMSWMNNWLAQGIYTFLVLEDGADPGNLESELSDMMERHFPERADNYFLKLQAFERMFLYGDEILHGRGMRVGSIRFLMTFGLSAVLILLIASVNYINLSLSRASQTKKEVGIRKVLGSKKRQLITRFVFETMLGMLIAATVGWLVVYLALPSMNALTGKDLPVAALWQPLPLLSLVGFVLGLGIAIGIYPASILSAPSVAVILKTSSSKANGTGLFGRSLLSLQYAASIFLVICTIVIIRQTHFLENKPLGFDKEQVLVVDVSAIEAEAPVFENLLRAHPNIVEVSTCRSALGAGSYTTTVVPEGYSDELSTRIFGIDQEFFNAYGLEIVEGRGFRAGSRADSSFVIVNETLVNFMGWEEATNKSIRFSQGDPVKIIGVVNDFHVYSLATSDIEPMVMYLSSDEFRNASIKLGNGDVRETIDYIDRKWQELEARTPLSFHFVDQWFADQYDKQRQLLRITMIYSLISLLLCGMGLYGITSLILQQRRKEMSIRRILGAHLTDLLTIINKQFIGVILIGFVVAGPLAYWAIERWLSQFSNRIAVGGLPWIVALSSVAVISILIISLLSLRAANSNPSDHLRSE